MRGGGGDAGAGGSRGPFDRLRANGRGERPCEVCRSAGFRDCGPLWGCFGIRLVVGLAQISYKSKKFLAEYKQPLLILDEPPLTIDADHAANDRAGAPEGMGSVVFWLRWEIVTAMGRR